MTVISFVWIAGGLAFLAGVLSNFHPLSVRRLFESRYAVKRKYPLFILGYTLGVIVAACIAVGLSWVLFTYLQPEFLVLLWGIFALLMVLQSVEILAVLHNFLPELDQGMWEEHIFEYGQAHVTIGLPWLAWIIGFFIVGDVSAYQSIFITLNSYVYAIIGCIVAFIAGGWTSISYWILWNGSEELLLQHPNSSRILWGIPYMIAILLAGTIVYAI